MARWLASALLATGTVAAPSSAQEATAVWAVPTPLPDGPALPGDDKLSCEQILAESKGRLAQLDEIEVERNAMPYKKGARTRALEAAGMVGGLLPGPMGQAAAMASLKAQMASTAEDAKANYGEIDRKWEWVMDRMDHMNGLYPTRCM